MNLIEVSNLSKKFGNFVAVDQLSLQVQKGQIFGLLGPNAAGKSTTIRMLSGALSITSGKASIVGYDLVTESEKIKAKIGYVSQFFGLYPELTVIENLQFYAGLYGVTQIEHLHALLEEVDLTQFVDRRAGNLSGGYKRRLSLAGALAHDPELIFLDEPTAGIDPVTRKELWDFFYELAAKGKTLFVTTHYMEEAERCDAIAFIHHGKLVARGTPESVRHSLDQVHVLAFEQRYNPKLVAELKQNKNIMVINQFGNQLRLLTHNSFNKADLEKALSVAIGEVSVLVPSLEDVFVYLTLNKKSR